LQVKTEDGKSGLVKFALYTPAGKNHIVKVCTDDSALCTAAETAWLAKCLPEYEAEVLSTRAMTFNDERVMCDKYLLRKKANHWKKFNIIFDIMQPETCRLSKAVLKSQLCSEISDTDRLAVILVDD
jgi:hypothetical protein